MTANRISKLWLNGIAFKIYFWTNQKIGEGVDQRATTSMNMQSFENANRVGGSGQKVRQDEPVWQREMSANNRSEKFKFRPMIANRISKLWLNGIAFKYIFEPIKKLEKAWIEHATTRMQSGHANHCVTSPCFGFVASLFLNSQTKYDILCYSSFS